MTLSSPSNNPRRGHFCLHEKPIWADAHSLQWLSYLSGCLSAVSWAAKASSSVLWTFLSQTSFWSYHAILCMCMYAKLPQLCPTICDITDCSLPSSSVNRILQARILEWVAMPSSRVSSQPRDWTFVSYDLLHWQVGSLPLSWLGSSNPILALSFFFYSKLSYNTLLFLKSY